MTIIQLASGLMRRLGHLKHEVSTLQTSQDAAVVSLQAKLDRILETQILTLERLDAQDAQLGNIEATLANIESAVIEPDQAAGIRLTITAKP